LLSLAVFGSFAGRLVLARFIARLGVFSSLKIGNKKSGLLARFSRSSLLLLGLFFGLLVFALLR